MIKICPSKEPIKHLFLTSLKLPKVYYLIPSRPPHTKTAPPSTHHSNERFSAVLEEFRESLPGFALIASSEADTSGIPTAVLYPARARFDVRPHTRKSLWTTSGGRPAMNCPAFGPLFFPMRTVYIAPKAFFGFTPISFAVE